MNSRKKTNYEAHKDYILMRASDGSSCFDCQARSVCNCLCKERGIDPAKHTPPCREVWFKWADMEAE